MRGLLLGAILIAAAACHRATQAPSPDPAASAARYAAGKAALEAGRLDEAEAIFRRLSETPARADEDPALRDNALLALASLRKDRGDTRGAMAYAQKVVDRRPQDTEALAVLIELAHDAGDLSIEIAARTKLVVLDPDDLAARLMLAGALTAAKENERAKAAFLSYEDARSRIVTALGKSRDPVMRRAAAHALGAAHDGGTARALVLAMTDRDASVRAEAVRAVISVGLDLDPEVRPALRAASTVEKDDGVLAALREALATPPSK